MENTNKIFDISTGEEIITPLSPEEIVQIEANIAKAEIQAETQAAKAAEKQAILDQLGITAEQAKLLLS